MIQHYNVQTDKLEDLTQEVFDKYMAGLNRFATIVLTCRWALHEYWDLHPEATRDELYFELGKLFAEYAEIKLEKVYAP